MWVYDGGQEGEGKERGFISVAGACRGLECSEGGKGCGIDMENGKSNQSLKTGRRGGGGIRSKFEDA